MDKNLNQDLQKELRREAIKRNWLLFKQSKFQQQKRQNVYLAHHLKRI